MAPIRVWLASVSDFSRPSVRSAKLEGMRSQSGDASAPTFAMAQPWRGGVATAGRRGHGEEGSPQIHLCSVEG